MRIECRRPSVLAEDLGARPSSVESPSTTTPVLSPPSQTPPSPWTSHNSTLPSRLTCRSPILRPAALVVLVVCELSLIRLPFFPPSRRPSYLRPSFLDTRTAHVLLARFRTKIIEKKQVRLSSLLRPRQSPRGRCRARPSRPQLLRSTRADTHACLPQTPSLFSMSPDARLHEALLGSG